MTTAIQRANLCALARQLKPVQTKLRAIHNALGLPMEGVWALESLAKAEVMILELANK